MKKCCMCQLDLPLGCFKANIKRKDGLQSQCINCQKEYRRRHYLNNKRKYVLKAKKWKDEFVFWWREYKSQFSCAQCGESHPACIHFHHHDDNKEECVAKLVANRCKQKVLKEIKKCTPLCANCHAKEHWSEMRV